MSKPAIIVDLDGTLCNSDHRIHHVMKTPPDYDSFNKLCGLDTPNLWCIEIVNRFKDAYDIIFITGRPSAFNNETTSWLKKYLPQLPNYQLYMSSNSDKTNAEYKKGVYNDLIRPHYRVLFALDDDPRVADMWKEQGVLCLNPWKVWRTRQ
jgi:hypothetical protein